MIQRLQISLSGLLLFFMTLSHVCAQCHNHCSYNGICNTDGRCECVAGFKGSDCSERVCPLGSAFSDIAYSTDSAHRNVECSNRGLCNQVNGNCECMDGFAGIACERMLCPNECSNNGKCMSYHDFALHTLNTNSESFTYNSVWDSQKTFGCVCDYGYTGYDCSLRICASGDDPLTVGGVQEKQLMKCTANSGTFILYFEGRHSKTISANGNEQDVEIALNAIKGVDDVSVSFSEGSRVCRNDVINIVQITFNGNFGPLAPLVPVDIDLSAGAILEIGANPSTQGMVDDSLIIYTPTKGTKENAECSNRGLCDYATGTCQCHDFLFVGSDGYGGPGNRGDCGHPLDVSNVTSCPQNCSNRGVCNISTKSCSCEHGYTGFDCSLRTCPKGKSWFSYPSGHNTGHNEIIECSNMGICERNSGYCICHKGYFGSACEYMGCGPNMTFPCSGNGVCLSMRQLGAHFLDSDGNASPQEYGSTPNNPETWDADRIYGCFCDDGYEGYDCSLRSCPLGDDPNTENNHNLEICSNHGLCNYLSGDCECMPGWGSSDGAEGPGNKRDCGYRLPISVLPRKGIRVIKKYYYKPWYPT